MEGVVLYVALVRVFIKHPKCYIVCFTLLSYGLLIVLIITVFIAGQGIIIFILYVPLSKHVSICLSLVEDK